MQTHEQRKKKNSMYKIEAHKNELQKQNKTKDAKDTC
jgi:hypothetical protein